MTAECKPASGELVSARGEGERDGGVGGRDTCSSGMSKTWWVGRQSCSVSAVDWEPSEFGGEGGR